MQNILTDELVAELGINDLPPEKRDEAIERAGNVIFQGAIVRILEKMTDEDKEKFYDVMEKNPDGGDPVVEFLQEKVPDLADIIAEEVENFRAEVVEILPKE